MLQLCLQIRRFSFNQKVLIFFLAHQVYSNSDHWLTLTYFRYDLFKYKKLEKKKHMQTH